MPVRTIVRLGHPALRGVARALKPREIGETAFQELVEDLIATMRAAHGVGLAAPQVGESLQVFVYELASSPGVSTESPEPAGTPSRPATPTSASTPTSPATPAPPPTRTPPTSTPLRAARAEDAHRQPSDAEREGAGAIPLHVVINPMLTPQGGELVYDWEGCLSIPDLRGLVPRHPAVRVRGLDRHGQPLDYVAKGLEARIVQHEFDHLNGVVFLDRMRDLRALAFREEWERYMAAGAAEPGSPAASTAAAAQPPEPALATLGSAAPADPEAT
jgi:peptide deformylase